MRLEKQVPSICSLTASHCIFKEVVSEDTGSGTQITAAFPREAAPANSRVSAKQM